MNVITVKNKHFNQNIKTVLNWCIENFEDVAIVTNPTVAELHRFSYDNSIYGITVFYFRDEVDYTYFYLKWM